MGDYQVYKQIGGRKIYVVIKHKYPIQNAEQAIDVANKYFKESKKNLTCEEGRVIGNDLYLDSTSGKYPNPMAVHKYDVFVVTRK